MHHAQKVTPIPIDQIVDSQILCYICNGIKHIEKTRLVPRMEIWRPLTVATVQYIKLYGYKVSDPIYDEVAKTSYVEITW